MKTRVYSEYTRDAARLLGHSIQLARKELRLTEKSLAERVGISRATLQKIEKGDLKCEIGIVFETAAIVGIRLFDVELLGSAPAFSSKIESMQDKIALLPKTIRSRRKDGAVNDEF